jgi:apolipoprotein N-acyltransferase
MALAGVNIYKGLVNSLLQVGGMCIFLICFNKFTKKKLYLAWLFSMTWLSVSVWWLYIALHDVGGMPWLIAIIAIALLCGGLAIYYAVALYIYSYCQEKLRPLAKCLLFAACWTAAELARAQWFTGFPWSAIGYAHVNGLLSYAAPWVGVYGVGFLSAVCASWLALQLSKPSIKKVDKLLIACLVLFICLPSLRKSEERDRLLTVNLLQGNISQITKYNSGRQQSLDWYATQALSSEAELTVLPEIAIPFFKEELPNGYWEKLTEKYETGKQILILGIPTLDKEKGYGNSAVGLGFGSEQQYDKYHLVPFGEFTPESLKWFTRLMVNELGDFNRCSITQAPFIWKTHKLSLTICYEDLFGEELAARFVEADQAPTLFVNISNIAWFGDTMVVNQHLDIARMRSLEFDRPTVRATNTGGTAVISAEGVIRKQLPTFVQGNLTSEVNIRIDKGITPFAYWAGHWGLKPMWMLCLLIMGWAVIKQYKSSKVKHHL